MSVCVCVCVRTFVVCKAYPEFGEYEESNESEYFEGATELPAQYIPEILFSLSESLAHSTITWLWFNGKVRYYIQLFCLLFLLKSYASVLEIAHSTKKLLFLIRLRPCRSQLHKFCKSPNHS